MPEWFRKKFFHSRRSMERTLLVFYGISILFLIVAAGTLTRFVEHGDYEHFRHFLRSPITFRGKEAIIPVYGTVFGSIVLLLVTIYLTICYVFMDKKGRLRDIPGIYICGKFENVLRSYSVAGNICPDCGGILEDLIGFYERHPEKKL